MAVNDKDHCVIASVTAHAEHVHIMIAAPGHFLSDGHVPTDGGVLDHAHVLRCSWSRLAFALVEVRIDIPLHLPCVALA